MGLVYHWNVTCPILGPTSAALGLSPRSSTFSLKYIKEGEVSVSNIAFTSTYVEPGHVGLSMENGRQQKSTPQKLPISLLSLLQALSEQKCAMLEFQCAITRLASNVGLLRCSSYLLFATLGSGETCCIDVRKAVSEITRVD